MFHFQEENSTEFRQDCRTSLVVWKSGKVFSLVLVCCGFNSQSGHTKECKNGTHRLSALHSINGWNWGVTLPNDSRTWHCCCSLLPQGIIGQMQRSNLASFWMCVNIPYPWYFHNRKFDTYQSNPNQASFRRRPHCATIFQLVGLPWFHCLTRQRMHADVAH